MRGHSFFSSLPQQPMTFDLEGFLSQKEPVFPFLMLSAKQGNYWYNFYNV